MSFYQNLLENTLYLVDSISNWIRYMRVGSEDDEFNSLQRVPDSIVHPLDPFETSQHLNFSFSQSQLPVIDECESQPGSQRASDQTKWAVPMHPVVIDEPLKKDGNQENKESRDD